MALLYMELPAAAPGFDMRQCREVSLAGFRRAAIDGEPPRVSLARSPAVQPV